MTTCPLLSIPVKESESGIVGIAVSLDVHMGGGVFPADLRNYSDI